MLVELDLLLLNFVTFVDCIVNIFTTHRGAARELLLQLLLISDTHKEWINGLIFSAKPENPAPFVSPPKIRCIGWFLAWLHKEAKSAP